MKYIVTMLLLAVSLMATELNWFDNYDDALKAAKKEHKLIYVFITSSQCRWCHKFEKTTLQDEGIKKRLKSEFITVHLVRDFDTVPQEFQTSPVPRHYFTDSKGKILYDALGYRDAILFDSFMDNAHDRLKITK